MSMVESQPKSILILGANIETAAIVKIAKGMGLRTVVANPFKESPAKLLADFPCESDPSDSGAIDKLIWSENISAVLLGVSDPMLPQYQQICARHKLPCYADSISSRFLSSKVLFSEICAQFSIQSIPQYGVVTSTDHSITDEMFPVVVKPVDGGAAMGVMKCTSQQELVVGINRALEVSLRGQVMIEKAMECDDMFAYYTFVEGEAFLSAIADRYKSHKQEGLDRVCLYADYPSKNWRSFVHNEHPKLLEMFKYLKLRNGVLSIQFFHDGKDFYAYDPGFRIQGEGPHIHLNQLFGYDHRKMLIDFAMGESLIQSNFSFENDFMFNGMRARTLWVLGRVGTISEIIGVEVVEKLKEVFHIQLRLGMGDSISAEMIGTEKQVVMRIYLQGISVDELNKTTRVISELLDIVDVNNLSMIQDLLKVPDSGAQIDEIVH